MKRNVIIISSLMVSTVLLWQCTDSNDSKFSGNLQESLESGSVKLNSAVNVIAQSQSYRFFNPEESQTMSSFRADSLYYKDSITLEQIKGIYDFALYDSSHMKNGGFIRLFKKTGESDHLIVNLPEELARHPHKFHQWGMRDSVLENNLTIDASEYHNFYTKFMAYQDYRLVAGLEADNENAGGIDVESVTSPGSFFFNTTYTFTNNYNINVFSKLGDTSEFSFGLFEGSNILFKESVTAIKSNSPKYWEKSYVLTLGNVEIVKNAGTDSILIYLNGVLQPDAKVEIIDKSDDSPENRSVCYNRDIQITFEDSTVTTVSELIGPSIDILTGLRSSVRNLFFAKNVVDFIAWDIYKGHLKEEDI